MPSNMLINNRTASTLLVGDVIAERAYYGSSAIFIPSLVSATGGTETVIEQGGRFYRVHTFLSGGTLTVTQGGVFVEYLVVGGGGVGLNGGGGGGRFRKFVANETGNTGDPLAVIEGDYDVIVGPGGVNNMSGRAGDRTAPSGLPSSFLSILAPGGDGAFNSDGTDIREGGDGGSGGGASTSSDNPPGDGGTNGGNGGAAQRGDGGLGQGTPTETTINGVLNRFSGGGGGGVFSGAEAGTGGLGGGGNGSRGNNPASDGETNTGGGGGGGGSASNAENGGNGGSGIVIVRYEITEAEYDAEAA